MILREVEKLLLEVSEIGNLADLKIYFGRAPKQRKLPYILLNNLGVDALDELDGRPQDDQTTVQIDIWAAEGPDAYDQLKTLGDACRTRLEGLRTTVGDVEIEGCALQRDNTLQSPDDAGGWLYRRSMDFRFTHTNAVARN